MLSLFLVSMLSSLSSLFFYNRLLALYYFFFEGQTSFVSCLEVMLLWLFVSMLESLSFFEFFVNSIEILFSLPLVSMSGYISTLF